MNRDQRARAKRSLRRAIRISGGQSGLARAIKALTHEEKLVQSHVWHWLNKCKQVPANRAVQIEQATKRRVRRNELRPDLWP